MPPSPRPRGCLLLLLLCSVVAACGKPAAEAAKASPASAAAPPYTLDDTEVRPIHARALQRDYQLFVSFPESYRSQPDRRFPALFITDANYAFPLVRSIARRVGQSGKELEDFVLIGLSYAQGDTPEYSRRRDYTPTVNGVEDAVSDMPGRKPVFGQAEAYRRFLAEEVFPVVAASYRVDMHRKIFVGHSYGSLLGVHILVTEPKMFEQYILGSPSLWYDNKAVLAEEGAYARAHRDLPADVYLAVGSYETISPTPGDSRYNTDDDMVRDLRDFEKVLASRRYPGLRMQVKVIEDEDHLTVFPAIITRGLRWALPRKR